VSSDGKFVLKAFYFGTAAPARNHLCWPRKMKPIEKYWEQWRRALKMFFSSITTMALTTPLGLWFAPPPHTTTCFFKTSPRRLFIKLPTGWQCHLPHPHHHHRKDNTKCFNAHFTYVATLNTTDRYLYMASYITSGKSLIATGTLPVQHFPAIHLQTDIITSTFCQITPFYAALGLNRLLILLKVYALREELYAGRLWLSTWGRRSRRHMCISFSWVLSSRGSVLWKSAGEVPFHKQERTDKRGLLLGLCAMMKYSSFFRTQSRAQRLCEYTSSVTLLIQRN
jgi:hypothetical protein